VAYENNEQKIESVYSKRIKAGKRRTYFFDVRATRSNDYFLTITESRKRFNDNGYDRHKIFLYKEDFNKFIKGLGEAIDFVKTDLMPDFDFDAFNHDNYDENYNGENVEANGGLNHVINETTEATPVTAPKEADEIIENIKATGEIEEGVNEMPEPEAKVEPVVKINNLSTEEVDKW
jgi:hypothetical protein